MAIKLLICGFENTGKSTTASRIDNSIDGFSAYPNPIKNNRITIESNSSDTKTVQLFNVLGRRVFNEEFSGVSKSLELNGLSSGIYILKVTENSKTVTQKLIKQ